MKKSRITTCLAATLFCACASKVVSLKDVGGFKEQGIGFAAFSYSSVENAHVEVEVRNEAMKRSFQFYLDENEPAVLDDSTGPYGVYRKYLQENKTPPLTVVPLPVGTYVFKYLRVRKSREHNSWKASEKTLQIQKNKVVYIGSYTGKITWFLGIPAGLDLGIKDELDSLSREMGIQDSIEKKLCPLKT